MTVEECSQVAIGGRGVSGLGEEEGIGQRSSRVVGVELQTEAFAGPDRDRRRRDNCFPGLIQGPSASSEMADERGDDGPGA